MDLFDLAQHRQIRNTHQRISSMESAVEHRVKRASNDIDDLEERFERMRTLCEALWTLVCETTGLTDEHLAYKLYELDMADGQRDNQKQRRAEPCTDCGAKVNHRAKVCQFCGAAGPTRSPWDAI